MASLQYLKEVRGSYSLKHISSNKSISSTAVEHLSLTGITILGDDSVDFSGMFVF